MTKRRFDGNGTEFGLWLRNQPDIDSSLGFVTSDIDYVWMNYKTGKWMFIEEKRYNNKTVTISQRRLFDKINKLCKNDKDYKGFHLITFENTNPDDGAIYIDNKPKTRQELIDFLQFKF